MKNEIFYRIFRIVFLVLFLVFATFLRSSVKADFDAAYKIADSMPKFVVTSLNNSSSLDLNEEHSIEIKNTSNKKEKVTFIIDGDKFPYGYMNYSVSRNGNVIKTGVVRKNEALFSTEILANDKKIYEVKFWINSSDVSKIESKEIFARLSFI